MKFLSFKRHKETARQFGMLAFPPKFIDPELERQFINTHLKENLVTHRLSVVIAMLSLGIFGFVDYRYFPWEEARWLILSRGIAWIGFLTLILLTLSKNAVKKMQIGYPATVIWVGLTILSNLFMSSLPIVYQYYVGIIMAMMYGYIFIRTNWHFAVLTGSILHFAYFVSSLLIGFPPGLWMTSNMFIFVANIFGMMGNYTIEFISRKEYWRAIELKQEEENLRVLNQQMDQLLMQQSEELRNSTAFMKQLNTGVGNDLKAPLNAIRNYLELLSERNQDHFDQFSEECMTELVRLTQRMSSMIDSLINFSLIQDLSRGNTKIDTNVILEIVTRRLRTEVKTSRAVIENDDLPAVIGDENLLVILFTDLLSNAIKYRGEAAPHIKINASKLENSNQWKFSFADNGMGISETDLPHLFHFFTRFSRAKNIPGIGMGLAICKRIIELHGGQIWVESEVDQGSTFYFTLSGAIGEG